MTEFDIYSEYTKIQHSIDVVTFDFFDTLFVRPLRDPEDVFDAIGRRFEIPNFRILRQNAQRLGFERMHLENRKEIIFDDIYSCFDLPAEKKREIQSYEVNAEEVLLHPNKEMVEFYNFCRKTKKVAIISDMYLPKKFFERVLTRHKLEFDYIFVSSELNATKRDDGEIFSLAALSLGVAPNRILHIGDSFRSDVERAREKSFHTFHYVESRHESNTPANFSESLSFSLYRTEKTNLKNEFEKIGFNFGGPAISAFMEFLEKETQNDGIETLLFISRDGYIMNEVCGGKLGGDHVRSGYFYGSRTSFNMSAITIENFSDFIPFLVSGCLGLSTHEVLERIDVECPSSEVLSDLGLGDDVRITEDNLDLLLDFLTSYKWPIIRRASENRKALFSYLLSLGIKPGTKLGLVDVGWSGTTLEAFSRALSGMFDVDLTGYFLCLVDTPERKERSRKLRMKSLLNSDVLSESEIVSIYKRRVIAELMFTAPHASVIGYSFDSEDGAVEFITDEGRAETIIENMASPSLMKGMMIFYEKYRDIHSQLGLDVPPLEAVRPFVSYLANITDAEMQIFQGVRNFDAWGSSKNFDLLASHQV